MSNRPLETTKTSQPRTRCASGVQESSCDRTDDEKQHHSFYGENRNSGLEETLARLGPLRYSEGASLSFQLGNLVTSHSVAVRSSVSILRDSEFRQDVYAVDMSMR